MKKSFFKYFVSILISAGVLFLLLQSVEPKRIVETLSSIRQGMLSWILLAYVGMLVFRTLRYRVLFGSAISFSKLFGIVNLYNFLNEFLPFRTGELAYLYLIRQMGVSAGKNVSSLIVVRLFDFLMVVVLGFSALGMLLNQGLHAFGIEKYLWLFPVILVVGLVAFLFFLKHSPMAIGFFLKPFRRVQKLKSLVETIEHLVGDLVSALKDSMQAKTLVKISIASLGVWICATVSYWLIFVSLGVPLSLIQMFFVIAFPALVLIVPLQGIAHVGTFEGPVIAGMLAVGIDKHIALAGSLSGHVMIFSLAILSGLVGLGITACIFGRITSFHAKNL